MKWVINNGITVNNAACDLLASELQGLVDSNGYSMEEDFSCNGVDTSGSSVTACGLFTSEQDAYDYFGQLEGGSLQEIATAIGFGSGYPNNVCVPSTISAVQYYRGQTYSPCNNFELSSDCRSVEEYYPHPKCTASTDSPYTLTYSNSYALEGDTVYCWEINVDDSVDSRCSNSDLDKIEILSTRECQASVLKYWTSRDESAKMSPVWRRQGLPSEELSSLALNRLGLDKADADGVKVCFSLSASGDCPTLEDLCYTGADAAGYCRYATFDEPNGCCDPGIGYFSS